jgi:hypothetical protein
VWGGGLTAMAKNPYLSENEIGFLLMNEEQIKRLVQNIGPQAKLLQVHISVCLTEEACSINEKVIFSYIYCGFVFIYYNNTIAENLFK